MCLKDASILPREIDKIILVGGATRTPLVHEIIKSEIGIEPHYEISPDLIVSMGAAIQGGVIAGYKTHSILVDITPYTFGTSAIGEYDGQTHLDVFVPIIKRNTPLPVSKGEVFYTVADNQEEVDVNIYQGEEPLAEDNIFIGNFLVKGLSKVPGGNEIVLNLELDINGILKVTAIEKCTGLSKVVTMDTKNIKTHLDIAAAQKNIASFLTDEAEDEEAEVADAHFEIVEGEETEKQPLLMKAKDLRKRAEKLLSSIGQEDAQEIRDLLGKSRDAVNAGDTKRLSEINTSLEDMIFYLED